MDFELLDVWEFPIQADSEAGEDFAFFYGCFKDAMARHAELPGAAGFLASFRVWLGRVLKLDSATERLPIPGCRETSLSERMTDGDRALNQLEPSDEISLVSVGGFQTVYLFPDESLEEISNKTVHALLHLSWVNKGGSLHTARLAVYVKARGGIGRWYIRLITPFRYWLVYPALMKHVRRSWAAYRLRR